MSSTLVMEGDARRSPLDNRPSNGLLARIRRALKLRRDYRHLENLPDYLLDDIGITRADLRAAHRRVF